MPTVLTLDRLPDDVRRAVENPLHGSRIVCPVCDGGSTREASLSIRRVDERDGLVKLSCWRSTCGYYAYVLAGDDVKWHGKRMKEPRIFRDPTTPLQGEPLSILQRDYGLVGSFVSMRGWRLTEDGEALVVPILDRFGGEIGHMTRTLTKPKRVMTYKATSKPFVDFWAGFDAKPAVIVEDCLSAARLAQLGFSAVALLGTNMSIAQAQEIAAFASRSNKPTYLALDADAWEKSLKITQRMAHVLTMRPVPLTLDVKDMPDDKLILDLFGE